MIKTLPENIFVKGLPAKLQHVAAPGTYRVNIQIGEHPIQKNILIKINDEENASLLQIYFAVNCSPQVCFLPLVNFSWLKETITIEFIERVEAQPFQQILIAAPIEQWQLYGMSLAF